jgi:AraC-like DNA-binding protein
MAAHPDVRLLMEGSARREPGYHVSWRRLPGLLIEWVDRGAWQVEVEGRETIMVPSGKLLLVAPECRHCLTAIGPSFTSRWLVAGVAIDGLPLLTGADLPSSLGSRGLIDLARQTWRPAGDPAGLIRRAACLHELVAGILDALPPQPWPAPRSGRLAGVLAAIESRLGEPLTRSDMARVAGLSPTRFHAVFVAATGLAPMAWLRYVRLRRARELLGSSDLPIGEIASRCGFASPYHFSRLFHRHEGSTPSAWRAGLQRDPLLIGR